MNDIAAAVTTSTQTGVNIPQIVGTENGDVMLLSAHDWQTFLAPYFNPLPAIKSYHHMRFDAEHPGVVFFRKYDDSEESSFQLLKNPSRLPPLSLPRPIQPPGLSGQRSQYLFDNIRQFCAQDEQADRTCPNPATL